MVSELVLQSIFQGFASSRVLGRAGLVLAWRGGARVVGGEGAWGLGKATYSQAKQRQSGKQRTVVRQAKDSQAKQRTVRQAKDRCQAKQRQSGKHPTVP